MEDIVKKLVEVIEQQKVLIEKLISQPGSSAQASNSEFLMESLSKSICDFTFDPENGILFKTWYARYEDLFSCDAAALDDAAKVRLLLRKLGTVEHQRYIDYILPKFPKDYNFNETVKKLKDIFDAKESIFSTRYKAFQLTKKDDEDFVSYASRVNKQCEDFQLNKFSADQFKCLMFVIGLKSDSDRDIRSKLLLELEEKSSDAALSLETLKSECERIQNLKLDNALFNQPAKVHHVQKNVKKSENPKYNKSVPNKNKCKPNESNTSQPRYPCWKCGDMHYVKFCKFSNHTCSDCNTKGHKEGYCSCVGNSRYIRFSDKSENSDNSTSSDSESDSSHKSNQKSKSKHVKSIRVSNELQDNRRYVDVSINHFNVPLQFDTASDITIVSESVWKKLGCPSLKSPIQQIKDASFNRLSVLGEFDCQIKFRSTISRGKCFVSKNKHLNLLGLDFITSLGLFEVPINVFCKTKSIASKIKQSSHPRTIVNQDSAQFSMRGRRDDSSKPIRVNLVPGQHVASLQSYNNRTKWCNGQVVERIGKVMYNIQLENGKLVRTHVNFIHNSVLDNSPSSFSRSLQK